MVATKEKQRGLNHEVVAVDLGSNSFHLLMAKRGVQGLQPIIACDHKVQLGLGLIDNKLCEKAVKRGLLCLKDFAAYTAGRDPKTVRIVGTHALRKANDSNIFTEEAQKLLGQTVEIISGKEEAALIYQGVEAVAKIQKNNKKSQPDPKIVVDIGGGSTELVVGTGTVIAHAVSIPMGCVSYLKYFPNGCITEQALNQAYHVACEQLSQVAERFKGLWSTAIGCSGTLLAVGQVMASYFSNNGTKYGQNEIIREGLQELKSQLLKFETIDSVRFQGLSESRRSIFASGLIIVMAVFDSFAINTMSLSTVGLREGLAWQLLDKNSF